MKTTIVIVRKQHTGQKTTDVVEDAMDALIRAEKLHLIDEALIVIGQK